MTDTQPLIDNRPPSVATLFLERVEATPDGEAYLYPVPPAAGTGPDDWRAYTWKQAGERVFSIAAGLMDLGVRPEERVAVASSTRVDWILVDFGILCAGAATTTIYPSTNDEESRFILLDSGSRVLVAENAEQLAKVRAHRAELPDLRHVVVIDPEGVEELASAPAEEAPAPPADTDADQEDADQETDTESAEAAEPEPAAETSEGAESAEPADFVISLSELIRRGEAHRERHPDCVTDSVAALRSDQLATLIYTSGTTGRPKGVRLPHEAWSYMAKAIAQTGLVTEADTQYLWLPLAHVFGKVLTSGQVEVGHVTAVDGRIDRIIDNLPVVRPTYMAAVPRIFEKVYNGVASKAREGGAAKYRIFTWAAEVAREYGRVSQDNFRRTGASSVPLGLRTKHALADKLVYAKLRAAFGGRLRACISGSAALAPEIGYFFSGAGIHILEGYGLTESSAASFVNPGEAYRTGTVGKPLPGTEVRIADDGEILLRGPGIMAGYHGLPEKTAEVLDADGWLHTGDIGELSADGFLRLTDRKKDLFKTSGGKYIAPTEVEGRLKAACPFVSNVLVHGDGRNYCTALIALDEPTLMNWAREHDLGDRAYAEIVGTEQVRELIDGYVQRVNADLQRWQTIKKFRLLPRDLDVEHGELTPSLKLKRAVVENEYRDLLEGMYEPARVE